MNSGDSWTTYSDATNITKPYVSGSSATAFYSGARMRNATTYQIPTLNCPRSIVDLYTTSSAPNGNKQLFAPVALLTIDEFSFAGSGMRASYGSPYHANSYLRSGSAFWSLSPLSRSSDGSARGFHLLASGYPSSSPVNNTYGVRPAISLKSGTATSSGSGTAADPWVVTAPSP